MIRDSKRPKSMADIVADLKGLPIDEFFEESFKQLLLRDPEDITDLGIADDVGLRNDQLANLSDAYIKETHALEVALLELLRTYDRDAYTWWWTQGYTLKNGHETELNSTWRTRLA